MKKSIFALTIVFIMCAIFGCNSTENTKSDKLSVVTTIFPPYDFARSIGGDKVEVSMLIKPGAEVHSFDPSPQDIISIGECDVFIYGGGESDTWVESILDDVDNDDLIVISMMDCVNALVEDANVAQPEEEDEEEVEYDEHVWTSPKNAVKIVEAIRDAFCTADATNKSEYESNATEYLEELNSLDSELRSIADSAENKLVVFADRFPFLYMFTEYGLDHFAAFPGCASETEPSAATVTKLIDTVNEKGISVVFYIEFSSQSLADTVVAATGAKKLCLHSCHNLTADDFAAGVTYVELMQQNIENLREALNG